MSGIIRQMTAEKNIFMARLKQVDAQTTRPQIG